MKVLTADCSSFLQSAATSGMRAYCDMQIDFSVERAVPTGWGTLATPAGAISLMIPVRRNKAVGSMPTVPASTGNSQDLESEPYTQGYQQ